MADEWTLIKANDGICKIGVMDENGAFVGMRIKGVDLTYTKNAEGIRELTGGTVTRISMVGDGYDAGFALKFSTTYNVEKSEVSYLNANHATWLDSKDLFALSDSLRFAKAHLTGEDDIFDAGPFEDSPKLYAHDGDDVIYGGDSQVTVYGGRGNDTFYAGTDDSSESRPSFYGGSGKDIAYLEAHGGSLYGGGGNDKLFGGETTNLIYGGSGNNVIVGGAEFDQLVSDSGNDILKGKGGSDTISAGFGDDVVYGGAGNDQIYGDSFDGGYNDQPAKSAPQPGTHSDKSANDTLYGGGGRDFIDGVLGDDVLYGGNGFDALIGAGGDDTLYGGNGKDQLVGMDGDDLLYGGQGADVFIFFYVDGVYGHQNWSQEELDALYPAPDSLEDDVTTIKDFEVDRDKLYNAVQQYDPYFQNPDVLSAEETYQLFLIEAQQQGDDIRWTDAESGQSLVIEDTLIEEITVTNFMDVL